MKEFFDGLLPYLPTIVAVITIVIGYKQWKREFLGMRKIIFLEDILTNFYKARDAIADIRNPVIYSGEGSSFTATEDTSQKPMTTDSNMENVFRERYLRHRELFNQLHIQKFRFMATFRAVKPEPFDRLFRVVRELQNACAELKVIDNFSEPLSNSEKESKVRFNRILFSSFSPGKDEIAAEVEILLNSLRRL